MNEQLPVQTKNRYVWIDALRIICMIAVIFIHTTAKVIRPVSETSGRLFASIRPLFGFAVPVFTMISGSFLLDPERSFSTKDLFRRKAFRLIVAWLFWTVLYAVAYYFVGEVKGNLKALIANLISGPGHLWYLQMLIGLYLLTPLIRRITSSEKYTKYFLALSFVITFVIPTLVDGCGIIDYFIGDRLNTSTEVFASDILSDFHIYYSEGYAFYYVLGYYLRKKELKEKTTLFAVLSCILGAIGLFVIEWIGCGFAGQFSLEFIGMKVCVMLMTVSIFVFGKNVIGKHLQREGTVKCVTQISKLSFGVYLLQSMMIVLVQTFFFDPNKYNPLWSVPLMALIVLTLCLAVTAVLKKIPGINKYIV